MDPHLIFGFLWVGYFALHSFLADLRVKSYFKNLWGKAFRFYRIVYNLLAIGLLVPIFMYQDSFSSPQIINFFAKDALAGVLGAIGVITMLTAFRNYNTGEFLGLQNPDTFEQALVTKGLHAYTRHPLYFGAIIFLVGYLLYASSLSALVTVGVIGVYLVIGTILEEKKLVVQYGDSYRAYQRKVKMLIPYVF